MLAHIDTSEIGLRGELALVGQSEVGYLALEVLADEDVSCGQIAVQELLARQILHALGDLIAEEEQIAVVERQRRVDVPEQMRRRSRLGSRRRRDMQALLVLVDDGGAWRVRSAGARIAALVLAQPVAQVAVRAVLDEHVGEAAAQQLGGVAADELDDVDVEADVAHDFELLQQRVDVGRVHLLICKHAHTHQSSTNECP